MRFEITEIKRRRRRRRGEKYVVFTCAYGRWIGLLEPANRMPPHLASKNSKRKTQLSSMDWLIEWDKRLAFCQWMPAGKQRSAIKSYDAHRIANRARNKSRRRKTIDCILIFIRVSCERKVRVWWYGSDCSRFRATTTDEGDAVCSVHFGIAKCADSG